MISFEPLYNLLDQRKITLTELSSKINLADTSLAVMLRQGNITTSTLSKICNVLHCSVGSVICYKNTDVRDKKTTKARTYEHKKGTRVKWEVISGLDPLCRISEDLGFASNYLTKRKSRDSGLPEQIINAICERYSLSREDICQE